MTPILIKKILRRLFPLFVVQFFTWLALFALWIYATPFFAKYIFKVSDTNNADYEASVRWVGIGFALYATFAAFFSFFITTFSRKIGQGKFHAVALLVGSIGLASLYFIDQKYLTLLSFVFIGVAWSSISNVPYTLVERVSEEENLDLYFKVFSFSVVIPQALAAFLWSYVNETVFVGQSNLTLLSGAISMLIASVLMFFLAKKFD